ncbi:hypothetical protein [Fimbriimonas ginsengisoli]|uniref:Lipoprotein n=1 Tax=Fimbriimonas ginsengisoli Gsoil 348 TaxID=661478 RepID=A0A068NL16_FIMGI|nr:hypothetical protein [Fimbriimonas ginsengisoli]AIE84166.1 hypothetical protein OP10G_0798 [Fimbriimonas ginsengisoli Gsoil 348]
MRTAIVSAVVLILAFILTARATCSNREIVPFLGKWSGGFEVESIRDGADTPQERERYRLQGYVQVYATRRSFKMHLQGEQEDLDLAGFWTFRGQRLTLKVSEIKIDDHGGADARNPNQKFISPEELNGAYSKPIVLDLSPDKKQYTGLLIGMGKLIGRHRFVKDSF